MNNISYSDIFKKHCPFKILGIPSNCNNIQIITKQYKIMLLKYHPDKGGDVRKYHLVSNAYNEILLRLELSENLQKSFITLKKDFNQNQKNIDNEHIKKQVIDKNQIYTKGKFDNKAFNNYFETNQYKDPNENGYTEDDFKNINSKKEYQLKTYDEIGELNSASLSSFHNSYNFSVNKDYTQTKPFSSNGQSLNLTDFKYAFTDGCFLLETDEDHESIYKKYYKENNLSDYKNNRENINSLSKTELDTRMNILQQRTNEEINRYEQWLDNQKKQEQFYNNLIN